MVFLVAQLLIACGGGTGTSSSGGSNSGGGSGTTPATGAATVYWQAPSTNDDGSAANISGFNIYRGATQDRLVAVATVAANETNYTFSDLSPGTTCFAVTAIGSGGTESALSSVVMKTI